MSMSYLSSQRASLIGSTVPPTGWWTLGNLSVVYSEGLTVSAGGLSHFNLHVA